MCRLFFSFHTIASSFAFSSTKDSILSQRLYSYTDRRRRFDYIHVHESHDNATHRSALRDFIPLLHKSYNTSRWPRAFTPATGRSPLRGGDPAAARPAQEDSVRLCSDDTVHLLPLGPERQHLRRLVHLLQHAVAAGQPVRNTFSSCRASTPKQRTARFLSSPATSAVGCPAGITITEPSLMRDLTCL